MEGGREGGREREGEREGGKEREGGREGGRERSTWQLETDLVCLYLMNKPNYYCYNFADECSQNEALNFQALK